MSSDEAAKKVADLLVSILAGFGVVWLVFMAYASVHFVLKHW